MKSIICSFLNCQSNSMNDDPTLLLKEINRLCDNFLIQQDAFTDEDRIREIFQTLKNLGYTFVTPRIEPTSKDFDFLSRKGKQDYRKLLEVRKKKGEVIKQKRFDQVDHLRDIEHRLEQAIRKDYMKNNGTEYFRLINEITKEIVFIYYESRFNECGDFGQFFKIK